jgi:hypothetical protein
MKERIQAFEAQRQELTQQIAFFRGALEQVQFERRTFVSGNQDAEVDFEDAVIAVAKTAPKSLFMTAEELSTKYDSPLSESRPHIPTAEDFEGPGTELLHGSRKAAGRPVQEWPESPNLLRPAIDVTEQGP